MTAVQRMHQDKTLSVQTDQKKWTMELETSVAKKRGRPVGWKKHRTATSDKPYPEVYSAMIAALPPLEQQVGYHREMILRRIDELTANALDTRTLEERFAELLGMSPRLASQVVHGLQPLTTSMLAVCAEKLEVNPTFLLTGAVPALPVQTPSTKIPSEEGEFLRAYQNANNAGKVASFFILALPELLEFIPKEIALRVIGSLCILHDAGAQELLRFLPSVLGRYKVRTGNFPDEFNDADLIFTPLHEWLGIFGPEKNSLCMYYPNSIN